MINNNKTIFATNTSSISVTELSNDKNYAERFAGLHFFNPAQLMKLVEIISTEKTSEQILKYWLSLQNNWIKRLLFVMMRQALL